MSLPIILLVEDNQGDVALTERALEKNKIANQMIVASDGQEALDYLLCEGKWIGRDIDDKPILILLDIKLPRIDGHETLRRIKADERTSMIPVVMLTSSRQEEDVLCSYKSGANSYIRKPVDFNAFVDCVKEIGCYWLLLNEPPPTKKGSIDCDTA
jgi:two-component system response regulator